MRRLALFLTLVLALGLAQAEERIIVLSKTHVFHTPLPMHEVVGSLGVQGLGGLGFDLGTRAEFGGFVEYREWRLRMAASGTVHLSGTEMCYTGALDWLGYTYESEVTYRIRLGGGGGLRICYPLDEEDQVRFLPVVEGILNLQLRVIPNVIADVNLLAGFPIGVGGSVGFALAF